MTGSGRHGEATICGSPSEVPEPQRSMVTSRGHGHALPAPGDLSLGGQAHPPSDDLCPAKGSTASGTSVRPRLISAER